MKRLYLFIAIMCFSLAEIAAQNSARIITLSHHGNETYFAYDKIRDAIEAAVDGDTISFSQGEYPENFILNKVVTLIGTGSEEAESWGNGTTLTGTITVEIPNSNENTNLVFDGLKFTSKVSLSSVLGDVTFRRCSWSIYFDYLNNNSIETFLLDRCECNYYLGMTKPTINKKLIAKNCKFISNGLDSYDTRNIFYNCTINPGRQYIQKNGENTEDLYCVINGTFYNCIICNKKGYLHNPNDASESIEAKFINCLYDNYNTNIDVTKKCTLEACYTNTSEDIDISKLTKEELENNQYFGTDGTVVGCYGGENPYSQINSEMPNNSISNNVHFNSEQEQIDVKINVE